MMTVVPVAGSLLVTYPRAFCHDNSQHFWFRSPQMIDRMV